MVQTTKYVLPFCDWKQFLVGIRYSSGGGFRTVTLHVGPVGVKITWGIYDV